MEKHLFVAAHPDDSEVMQGYAIAAAAATAPTYVLVASNGEASTVNWMGGCFCPGRT